MLNYIIKFKLVKNKNLIIIKPYGTTMRNLREIIKKGLAKSQIKSGKIQPHNKKKTASQFAVDTIAEWQAGLCLRQMHQNTLQEKVVDEVCLFLRAPKGGEGER